MCLIFRQLEIYGQRVVRVTLRVGVGSKLGQSPK